MPLLLPMRPLPVSDSPGGPYATRVDVRSSESASVYVRRESDKRTWCVLVKLFIVYASTPFTHACGFPSPGSVRTLEAILVPSQPPCSLDLSAVMKCHFHGSAFDALSRDVPVELVTFSQPEGRTDDSYRMTMRVYVCSSSTTMGNDEPMVDVVGEDVVFNLDFTRTNVVLNYVPAKISKVKQRCIALQATTTSFANSYVQWQDYATTPSFLRHVTDGVYYLYDGDASSIIHQLCIGVDIVVAKDTRTPQFVLSMNDTVVKATNSTKYSANDFHHSIAQYELKVAGRSFFQVIMLPGSACALAGTTITFREIGK